MAGEYFNPSGELVADNQEVWEEVVIPQVINDYVDGQRNTLSNICLLYTSPSPRDGLLSRMPSSA